MSKNEAVVLADSVDPTSGARLTTFSLTFPRFILAEVNTHRMLSRNSASSRAIPTELLIKRVRDEPFVPLTFNKRVKGMGVGEAFGDMHTVVAREHWLNAADRAADGATRLKDMELDKSRANRVLEPFLWHRAVVTATEWSNFFALRNHPDAQPEFRDLAQLMQRAMDDSEPQKLQPGAWHLPMLTPAEHEAIQKATGPKRAEVLDWFKHVAAGRLARWSFDTQFNDESCSASVARSYRLISVGHLSPAEHVARPFTAKEWANVQALQGEAYHLVEAGLMDEDQYEQIVSHLNFRGNFRGFVQMRKEVRHEHDFGQILAEAA